jgi:acid phosphatase family membrane protein YuiD
MKLASPPRCDLALGILLGLTALSLGLSQSGVDPTLCSVTLLGVAAFKAWVVVQDYFGLRRAAGPWRAILTTWFVAVALAAAAATRATVVF